MKKLENLEQLIKQNEETVKFTPPEILPFVLNRMNIIKTAFSNESFGYNILVLPSFSINNSADNKVNSSIEITLMFKDKELCVINTKNSYFEYSDSNNKYIQDGSNEYKEEIKFSTNSEKFMEIIENNLIEAFLDNQTALLVQKEQDKVKAAKRIAASQNVLPPISYNTPKPT